MELITEYGLDDLRIMEPDERILMRYGLARSPEHARMILYGGSSVFELWRKRTIMKRPPLRDRLLLLIRRIDGHNPMKIPLYSDENQISVRYRFREEETRRLR